MQLGDAGRDAFDIRDVTGGAARHREQAPLAGLPGANCVERVRNSRASLGCCCIVAVSILVLVLSSLASLAPTEYGLRYNRLSKTVDKSTVYRGGRHFIGPLNTFYVFPAIVTNLEFSDSSGATAPPLSTRTSAGLSVNVSVAFQYRLDQDGVGALYGRASMNYESLFLVNSRAVLLQAAGNYTNEQYWTARQQIGHDMLDLVNETLRQTWATCTGLQILKIDLPADYEASIVKTQVTNQNILTRQREQQAALIRAKIDVMVADKTRNITVTLAQAQANATLTMKSAEARAAKMKIDAEDAALGHVKDKLNLSAGALVGYQKGFAYQTLPNATFLFGVPNAVAVVSGGTQGATGRAPPAPAPPAPLPPQVGSQMVSPEPRAAEACPGTLGAAATTGAVGLALRKQ